MTEAQVSAREIRRRLWNPIGGHESSEIEVLSGPALRRRKLMLAVEKQEASIALAKRIDECARSIILEIRERASPDRITLPSILRAVVRQFGVSALDIRSDRRIARIVVPRHVYMYLGRHLTTLSLSAIGRRVGGKDHTTVLFAVRKISQLILVDPRLAADIDNIKWELGIR